jgi:hypothetical protein
LKTEIRKEGNAETFIRRQINLYQNIKSYNGGSRSYYHLDLIFCKSDVIYIFKNISLNLFFTSPFCRFTEDKITPKSASVVPPEDGRLTPETCRGSRHNKVIVKVNVY